MPLGPGVDSFGAQLVDCIGLVNTYAATASGKTPVANSTEPFFTIQGSATRTIYVNSIDFSMIDATGSTTEANVILNRYSAMSGGTAVALVPTLYDLQAQAATATVQYWTTLNTSVTTNPSTASPVAAVYYTNITPAAGVVLPTPYTFPFNQPGSCFVLRGASDWLGLCISAIGTTPLVDISVSWIEV